MANNESQKCAVGTGWQKLEVLVLAKVARREVGRPDIRLAIWPEYRGVKSSGGDEEYRVRQQYPSLPSPAPPLLPR